MLSTGVGRSSEAVKVEPLFFPRLSLVTAPSPLAALPVPFSSVYPSSVSFTILQHILIGVLLSLVEYAGHVPWVLRRHAGRCPFRVAYLMVKYLSCHGHQTSSNLCLCFQSGWKSASDFYFNNDKGQWEESKLMSPIIWIFDANTLGDREMMSLCHDDGRELVFIKYLLNQALLVNLRVLPRDILSSHIRKTWIKLQLTFGNLFNHSDLFFFFPCQTGE